MIQTSHENRLLKWSFSPSFIEYTLSWAAHIFTNDSAHIRLEFGKQAEANICRECAATELCLFCRSVINCVFKIFFVTNNVK